MKTALSHPHSLGTGQGARPEQAAWQDWLCRLAKQSRDWRGGVVPEGDLPGTARDQTGKSPGAGNGVSQTGALPQRLTQSPHFPPSEAKLPACPASCFNMLPGHAWHMRVLPVCCPV